MERSGVEVSVRRLFEGEAESRWRSCYSRHVSVNEHREERSGVEVSVPRLFEGEDNLIDIYLDSLL